MRFNPFKRRGGNRRGGGNEWDELGSDRSMGVSTVDATGSLDPGISLPTMAKSSAAAGGSSSRSGGPGAGNKSSGSGGSRTASQQPTPVNFRVTSPPDSLGEDGDPDGPRYPPVLLSPVPEAPSPPRRVSMDADEVDASPASSSTPQIKNYPNTDVRPVDAVTTSKKKKKKKKSKKSAAAAAAAAASSSAPEGETTSSSKAQQYADSLQKLADESPQPAPAPAAQASATAAAAAPTSAKGKSKGKKSQAGGDERTNIVDTSLFRWSSDPDPNTTDTKPAHYDERSHASTAHSTNESISESLLGMEDPVDSSNTDQLRRFARGDPTSQVSKMQKSKSSRERKRELEQVLRESKYRTSDPDRPDKMLEEYHASIGGGGVGGGEEDLSVSNANSRERKRILEVLARKSSERLSIVNRHKAGDDESVSVRSNASRFSLRSRRSNSTTNSASTGAASASTAGWSNKRSKVRDLERQAEAIRMLSDEKRSLKSSCLSLADQLNETERKLKHVETSNAARIQELEREVNDNQSQAQSVMSVTTVEMDNRLHAIKALGKAAAAQREKVKLQAKIIRVTQRDLKELRAKCETLEERDRSNQLSKKQIQDELVNLTVQKTGLQLELRTKNQVLGELERKSRIDAKTAEEATGKLALAQETIALLEENAQNESETLRMLERDLAAKEKELDIVRMELEGKADQIIGMEIELVKVKAELDEFRSNDKGDGGSVASGSVHSTDALSIASMLRSAKRKSSTHPTKESASIGSSDLALQTHEADLLEKDQRIAELERDGAANRTALEKLKSDLASYRTNEISARARAELVEEENRTLTAKVEAFEDRLASDSAAAAAVDAKGDDAMSAGSMEGESKLAAVRASAEDERMEDEAALQLDVNNVLSAGETSGEQTSGEKSLRRTSSHASMSSQDVGGGSAAAASADKAATVYMSKIASLEETVQKTEKRNAFLEQERVADKARIEVLESGGGAGEGKGPTEIIAEVSALREENRALKKQLASEEGSEGSGGSSSTIPTMHGVSSSGRDGAASGSMSDSRILSAEIKDREAKIVQLEQSCEVHERTVKYLRSELVNLRMTMKSESHRKQNELDKALREKSSCEIKVATLEEALQRATKA